MGIMVLDGILPNQVVLMGKVCGDSFTKNGEDFFHYFSFEAGVSSSIFLSIFHGKIVGVRRVSGRSLHLSL